MEISPSELRGCSSWLLQRARSLSSLAASAAQPSYSIAIDVNCPACQPPVSVELASYLAEFGDFPAVTWKAFDSTFIQKLAASSIAKRLGESPEQVTSSLARMGGAILEGPDVIPLTAALPHIFQVCLACKEPLNKPYHLHLNQKRFESRSAIAVIADSFLEWVESGGDPSQKTSEQAYSQRQPQSASPLFNPVN